MQYFVIEEQDKDWQPVIRKFTSEAFLEELIDCKYIYFFGKADQGFFLTEKAISEGYADVKDLFNRWYNNKRTEKVT